MQPFLSCCFFILSSSLLVLQLQIIKQADSKYTVYSVCEAEKDCNKVVTSIKVKNGASKISTVIHKVYTKTKNSLKVNRLKKPLRVEISNDRISASHSVHYTGIANARPREVMMKKKECKEEWQASDKSLACAKQTGSDGELIWDSQGFCCECSSLRRSHRGRENFTRCATAASNDGETSKEWFTAHCLVNDDLWYNIYDIDHSMIEYNITVRLLEFGGVTRQRKGTSIRADWKHLETFYYVASKRITDKMIDKKKTGSDSFTVEVESQFMDKQLLVPSLKHWRNEPLPPQYTNGPSEWLLVNKDLVDLSGTVCGKIGVSYSGFKYHPRKCKRQSDESCFTNQPLDLWEHDMLLSKENKQGQYMLKNFGQIMVGNSSSEAKYFALKIHHLKDFSLILKLDISNSSFIQEIGVGGRIVDSYVLEYQSGTGKGEILVEVENMGEIVAKFSVSVLHCVHSNATKMAEIDPGSSEEIVFTVQAYSERHECQIELFDSSFSLLQTGMINFKTNTSCFCYGACGCQCDNNEDKNDIFDCASSSPAISVEAKSPLRKSLSLVFEAVGLHVIIGIICALLMIVGFVNLACGGILFCRKTKAQKYADDLKKKGGVAQDDEVKKCLGTCAGAKGAKKRFKQKVLHLKEIGRKPKESESWRNYSYICTCDQELTDIKLLEILKAIFFVFLIPVFPCTWVGNKILNRLCEIISTNKKEDLLKFEVNKYLIDSQSESETDSLEELTFSAPNPSPLSPLPFLLYDH